MEQTQRVTKLEDDMIDVKTRLAVAESSIVGIKEDISSIKDDTKWLRRAITNAIIGLIVTGITALILTMK
ncbi:hemolysin XhlA family protein [Sporosarcina limicola]|uniref:Hemolysin activation protein n=1 Tax=Sporosarcina limicola TaxID=34101 RepID=A0A927MPN1_9BACL|nr:hemolysin XhlA family protein [Sporosarcina limicola]MBE1555071.1 hypothetical protein [Sporosarcina limicola]